MIARRDAAWHEASHQSHCYEFPDLQGVSSVYIRVMWTSGRRDESKAN